MKVGGRQFNRPVGRRILGLIALGALLVGLQRIGWTKPLNVIADYTITPVNSWFAGLGRGGNGFFGTVTKIGQLASQNAGLTAANADLRQRVSQDAELKVENAELRRVLNFSESHNFNLVVARVVAYQPDNFRQFLTINRGSRDGVKVGQAVVGEGILVGNISNVTPTSAEVFLVSDPDFRVAALSQESRATGIVSGQLGGGLLLDQVAQSDTISPGDTVITSGLGGEFPPGLIIGTIDSISTAKGAVFQSAKLSNGLTLSRLDLVSVITGEK